MGHWYSSMCYTTVEICRFDCCIITHSCHIDYSDSSRTIRLYIQTYSHTNYLWIISISLSHRLYNNPNNREQIFWAPQLYTTRAHKLIYLRHNHNSTSSNNLSYVISTTHRPHNESGNHFTTTFNNSKSIEFCLALVGILTIDRNKSLLMTCHLCCL